MIFNETNDIYSVTSLTKSLKNLVEGKYRFIKVQGEISNLKRPYSGHSYFTLKDNTSQLRSVLFKGQARYLEKGLEDGQEVVCHGRISIYEPRGDYQLIIDNIDFQGGGLLQLQFEKLKKQLSSEGLFDEEGKKDLPQYPTEIVLITSPSGAAVHDFLKIWRKRAYPCNLKVYPVRVQGNESAGEITKALDMVNVLLPKTDVIVLCRGGGSIEDLWSFNEEIVARAISQSAIPIVSAIGHEVDFTISDFCADKRAPTPTAAAEMLIPDLAKMTEELRNTKKTLSRIISNTIEGYQYRVSQNRRLLGDMNFFFTNSSLRLDHASLKLHALMEKMITRNLSICNELSSRLHNNSPETKVTIQEQRLSFITEKFFYFCKKEITDKEAKLTQQVALLDAVSPLATMARGYSITSKINHKNNRKVLVKKATQLKISDRIEIMFHTGKAECEVKHIEEQ